MNQNHKNDAKMLKMMKKWHFYQKLWKTRNIKNEKIVKNMKKLAFLQKHAFLKISLKMWKIEQKYIKTWKSRFFSKY